MRLAVRHTTRYRFQQPVIHALQRLHLTPKATQGQEILSWSMDFKNATKQLEYEDQHFNTTTLVSVEPGAQEVEISCTGLVDTHDFAGVIGKHAGHLPLWCFRGHTALTRPGSQMDKLAKDIASQELEPLPLLHALSEMVLSRMPYSKGTTAVGTTAEEALVDENGVCQDHAQVFIGVARQLGIPARYVSGYLMMDDRVEQEATHAWAEAHVDGLGWVGFDISNGISPDQRYVRVATGRDYRDAAPITGISVGTANEDLEVAVAVEQQTQEQ